MWFKTFRFLIKDASKCRKWRFRESRNPKFSENPLEISRLWRSHTTHQSDFILDPPLPYFPYRQYTNSLYLDLWLNTGHYTFIYIKYFSHMLLYRHIKTAVLGQYVAMPHVRSGTHRSLGGSMVRASHWIRRLLVRFAFGVQKMFLNLRLSLSVAIVSKVLMVWKTAVCIR